MMLHPLPPQPNDNPKVGAALDAIEADVLPTLSALLSSVAERATGGSSYDERGAELRDMSRQIIELTRFLAAVTADAGQASEASTRA